MGTCSNLTVKHGGEVFLLVPEYKEGPNWRTKPGRIGCMGFVDWKLLPKLETKLGGIGLWAWLIGGGSSFVLICDAANPQVAVHWPLPCNICYEFMFCLVSIKVSIF